MNLCRGAERRRIKAGGPIYDWEPERGMYLGLLRRPKPGVPTEQIRWIHSDARWFYHAMNAFDDGDTLHMDVTETGCQPFPWLHVDPGRTWRPHLAAPHLTRWSVDTVTGAFTTRPLVEHVTEMPRLDERFELAPYRHGYFTVSDPSRPPAGKPGQMTSVGHLDLQTGRLDTAWAGPAALFEEPQFVPRSPDAPEADGYLLAIRHHVDTMLSDLVVLDTSDITAGPVAVARLPFRVRPGTHGTWVDA